MDKAISMQLHFPRTLWRYRDLWWRLTQREILSRYRGSILGIGWSLTTPLAMLAIYTFVFSQVFKARWGGLENDGALAFAVNLFAGLIVFNLFSECISRSPYLITSNSNYVKKVVFPLEMLTCAAMGSSIFNAGLSLLIMVAFELIAFGKLPLSICWIPIIWTPLILFTIALSWMLAAAGVFLRDIGQIVAVALNMLMFTSPIFFPISALPAKWQTLLKMNPIAIVIEQTRVTSIQGSNPSLVYIATGLVGSILACELSFRAFQKAKRGFADVI